MDRSNTNEVVIAKANKALRGDKTIQLFPEVYNHRKLLLLQDILKLSNLDPKRQTTLQPNLATPIDHEKKRIGRPKNRWTTIALKEYWEKIPLRCLLSLTTPHSTLIIPPIPAYS